MNNDLFTSRCKNYFAEEYLNYLAKLDEPLSQGFFLNTNKLNKEDIFKIIDFDYKDSNLTKESFYHFSDNIGKTKAYELGLIYPQEISASLSSLYLENKDNIRYVVDLCAAPGGKTINILNRLNKDVLCISNDFNHSRALTLSSNLERLGLDNVIITNKEVDNLTKDLNGFADLVILDAPCSGEGMIRKYNEILKEYNLENINKLSKIQEDLLENAYEILNNDGYLIYSTCTYAFEEDENQVINFLNKHEDIELVPIKDNYYSKLEGTLKVCPLLDVEGQFVSIFHKKGKRKEVKIKYLKNIKEKIIDDFISENLNLDKYYLYKYNDRYYLSSSPLIDLKNNIIRYGIYLGEIKNKRLEISHCFYRANSLKKYFKYKYDLNDEEYDKYISGNELKVNLNNGYYLITYKDISLGYGKVSNNMLKNKYPKGLRRVI